MTADTTPFPRGRTAAQDRMGVREQIGPFAARVVRDHMPDQHREFYTSLPLIFIGAVDESSRPWASILFGPPGFMTTPDEHTLNLAAAPLTGDPLQRALKPGADIGLLGLEFETRRRNLLNGKVRDRKDGVISVAVNQAFGNCQKYIHRRTVHFNPSSPAQSSHKIHQSNKLGAQEISFIESADTLFIASTYTDGGDTPSNGADVSHRGGPPGFVKIIDKRTLSFPDYSGNNHFNTIGNLILNPRFGILFIDFKSGDLIYLSGNAEMVWDGPEVAAEPGAKRLVKCHIKSVRRLARALPLGFDFVDYSPSLARLNEQNI